MKKSFSVSELYDEVNSRETIQRANAYVTEEKIHDYDVEYSDIEPMDYSITARVDGNHGDKYFVEINVMDNEICDYSCECPAFDNYEGPCKHILALGKYHEQQLKLGTSPQYQKMSPTSYAGTRFDSNREASSLMPMLTTYKKFRLRRVDGVLLHKVDLLPVLAMDEYQHVCFRFKIGLSRSYLIKDIGAFVDNIEMERMFKYGEKLEFSHKLENFTEYGREVAELLCNIVKERENVPVFGYYSNKIKERLLPLNGDLDELFQLCQGKMVECQCFSGKDELLFKRENPKMKLVLRQKGEGYILTCSLNDFYLLEGRKNLYILVFDGFYACDESFSDAMRPLLLHFSKANALTIQAKEMLDFNVNIIPVVSPYATLETEVDLSPYELLELNSKLYLDTDKEENIIANLVTTYGETEVNVFDEGYIHAQSGDIVAEVELKNAILQYFSMKYNQLIISETDKIYDFLVYGIEELKKICELYITDRLKKITVKKSPSVSVGVKVKSDLLDINLDYGEFSRAELLDILEAYKQKKKYTRLKGGTFINLQSGALDTLSSLAEDLDISMKELVSGHVEMPFYRAPYIDQTLKSGTEVTFERDSDFKSICRNLKSFEDSEFVVPELVKAILRNYQKAGYRWLKTLCAYRFGGILADDMGLGKSLQIITLFLSTKETNKQSIIVCPTSLVLNWNNEFVKFAPEFKIGLVIGLPQERAKVLEDTENQIVITSYELLKRDIDLYQNKEFLFAVIDEAQYIKNHITQNAKAVKMLKSEHRFALTGTPIENNLSELWSIFDFVMPRYLYSYNRFKSTIESEIVRGEDNGALKRLQKMVQPFVLRRLKIDVLTELPPKVESVVESSLCEEQKEIYLANVEKIRTSLQSVSDGEFNKNKIMILAMLTKLRQICCSPSLVYDDYKGNSAKFEMCMELIRNSIDSGHKVLLFSQFTSMLEIISKSLTESEIPFYVLKGDTSKSERMRIVDAFNEDATPVFLLSLKAGGTGLNLTGADIVIHYDPWWNLSVQNQATDRAYRIGQDKSVQVYKLILKDTIEEKIMILQERKRDLADSVIKEGESVIGRMSKEEILQLFEV